jgi:hypothetical protein
MRKKRGRAEEQKSRSKQNLFSLFRSSALPLLLLLIASSVFIIYVVPLTAQQDELIDFPKRVEIKIEDPTQVVSQRPVFVDPEAPGLLAFKRARLKERAWGLPPIITPSKFDPKVESSAKQLLIWFTAHPSLPESLFYNALLAKEFKAAKGLVTFDHQLLSDRRTKGRGTYNLNTLGGELGSKLGAAADLNFEVSYKTKDLGWLDSIDSNSYIRRDLTLLDISSILKGSKGSEFQWTASFSGSNLRLESESDIDLTSDSSDSRATWLNLRIEANSNWPFLNPLDFGGQVEHLSTYLSSDSRQVTDLRLYARDNFISLSPFALRSGVELAAVSMRDDKGQEQPKILVNPLFALLTEIGDHIKLEIGANRSVARPRLDRLYFYQDFTELNPFLEVEREWRGEASLKVDFDKYLSTSVGASRRVIDGLTVYESSKGEFLSWKPVNLNAKVDSVQMGIRLDQLKGIEGLNLKASFSHEFQRGNFRMIPYQPKDFFELSASYSIGYGFKIGMRAEYVGQRAKDTAGVILLPAYFLWKPQLTKSFGDYALFFLNGVLSVGIYQLRYGYDMPQQFLDAGVTLKF